MYNILYWYDIQTVSKTDSNTKASILLFVIRKKIYNGGNARTNDLAIEIHDSFVKKWNKVDGNLNISKDDQEQGVFNGSLDKEIGSRNCNTV